jgi:hypothetical protein
LQAALLPLLAETTVRVRGGDPAAENRTETERTAMNKKLGLRPLDMAKLRARPFATIRGAAVPPHQPAHYLDALTDWRMCLNDQHGTCFAAWWANERRLVTHYLGAKEYYPTDDQLLQFYKTQNPNFPSDDEGMDAVAGLDYLVKVGGPDGVKALAWAYVDPKNIEEVHAAIYQFGHLCQCMTVQNHNEAEFDAGQPWTYDPSDTDAGGHGTLAGGESENPAKDVEFITWAKKACLTDSYVMHRMQALVVVVWPEHLTNKQFCASTNLAGVAQYYTDITGEKWPGVPITPAGCSPWAAFRKALKGKKSVTVALLDQAAQAAEDAEGAK